MKIVDVVGGCRKSKVSMIFQVWQHVLGVNYFEIKILSKRKSEIIKLVANILLHSATDESAIEIFILLSYS